jgi:hypothetical protein
VRGPQVDQPILVDAIRGDRGHPHLGRGPQGGGATAALQDRPLTDHGSWTDLGHGFAVHLDVQEPVENEEEVVAGLALDHQGVPGGDRPAFGLRAGPHDARRQCMLESGHGLGDHGGPVTQPPGGAAFTHLHHPLPEVEDPALGHELAAVVVDPVAREGAGADQLALDPAVGMQGDREGRPDRGRLDRHEGRRTRRPDDGDADAPPRRLHEADAMLSDLGFRPDLRVPDRGEHDGPPSERERRGPHVATAALTVADETAVLVHLDPGGELVQEPEAAPLLRAPRSPTCSAGGSS